MSRVSKPATNNSIDKRVKPRRNTPVAILTHSKRPNTFPKEHQKGLGAFILEPWWRRCTVLMFFRLCFLLSLLGHCIWKITKSNARETCRIQTMLGQPCSSIFSHETFELCLKMLEVFGWFSIVGPGESWLFQLFVSRSRGGKGDKKWGVGFGKWEVKRTRNAAKKLI